MDDLKQLTMEELYDRRRAVHRSRQKRIKDLENGLGSGLSENETHAQQEEWTRLSIELGRREVLEYGMTPEQVETLYRVMSTVVGLADYMGEDWDWVAALPDNVRTFFTKFASGFITSDLYLEFMQWVDQRTTRTGRPVNDDLEQDAYPG